MSGMRNFEEMYLLRDILAEVSHSARTPLSTLNNVIDEAREIGGLSSEAVEDADRAIKQFVDLLKIFSRLSRIQDEEPKRQDLSNTIRDAERSGVFRELAGSCRFDIEDTRIQYDLHPSSFLYSLFALAEFVGKRCGNEVPLLMFHLSENEDGAEITLRPEGKTAEAPSETLDLGALLMREKGVEVFPLKLAQRVLIHHGCSSVLQLKGESILEIKVSLPKPL